MKKQTEQEKYYAAKNAAIKRKKVRWQRVRDWIAGCFKFVGFLFCIVLGYIILNILIIAFQDNFYSTFNITPHWYKQAEQKATIKTVTAPVTTVATNTVIEFVPYYHFTNHYITNSLEYIIQ